MGIINRVLGGARRGTAAPTAGTGRSRRPRRGGAPAAPAGRGGGLLSGLLRRKGL